jgi:hypothetical protein
MERCICCVRTLSRKVYKPRCPATPVHFIMSPQLLCYASDKPIPSQPKYCKTSLDGILCDDAPLFRRVIRPEYKTLAINNHSLSAGGRWVVHIANNNTNSSIGRTLFNYVVKRFDDLDHIAAIAESPNALEVWMTKENFYTLQTLPDILVCFMGTVAHDAGIRRSPENRYELLYKSNQLLQRTPRDVFVKYHIQFQGNGYGQSVVCSDDFVRYLRMRLARR